nr:hypothetical protein Itr_chr02CG09390 [Ipomoea trifida]GMC60156.1 hypothetical protein Iba_chr02bCG8130 [Ipomoea batatas]
MEEGVGWVRRTKLDEMQESLATFEPIGEEHAPKMVRKKSVAKKPSEDVPICQGSGTHTFTKKDVQTRYELFMENPIFQPYAINYDALTEFGIRDEVEALIGRMNGNSS